MLTDGNPYAIRKTTVLRVITETPTIKTLRLKPSLPFSFKTGQFIELSVPGVGEAPFTPSSDPAFSDELEVTIMRVGRVTEQIHKVKKNDTVGIRGPFGAGYPVDVFKGQEVVVVGGGCGFAPVRSLMYTFFGMSRDLKKLAFRGGCKTPRDFLFKKELLGWKKRPGLDVRLTVDKAAKTDGWHENVGLVTTILDRLPVNPKNAFAVVCGPPIMMKFATQTLLKEGFREDHVYLSMEKNMSCGIGKCGHCRLGTYYACKDGPVFRFDQLNGLERIWE
ncbi:MAG: FAD/NAD(P)-binding protein [Spirochaetales bacterium]|nr:FAD/NAD(P)-binding protein [Spirochaetales bacterium]